MYVLTWNKNVLRVYNKKIYILFKELICPVYKNYSRRKIFTFIIPIYYYTLFKCLGLLQFPNLLINNLTLFKKNCPNLLYILYYR